MRGSSFIFVTTLLLGGCSGCFEGGSELAKGAGEAVGQATVDFGKGVGSGVDKSMEVTTELAVAAQGLGLSTTTSKLLSLDQHGIAVYFIAEQATKTKLLAKALNEAGQEVGRASVEVEFAADDAKYVEFVFDGHVDLQLVDKFVIETREPAGETDTASATAETPGA